MSGISIIDLVLQAGPVAKGVLLVLLFFSIATWAIIFMKLKTLRAADRQSDAFVHVFKTSKNLGATFEETKRYPGSPEAAIFREGFRELSYHMKGNPHPAGDPGGTAPTVPQGRSGEVLEGVGRTLRYASLKELSQMERHLTFLATTGSVTPFIGLFGTVWGIINAFVGIGAAGSANLGAVAPGIAEALIATAAGLAAAIPAVIGYNYFVNRIRGIGTRLDLFTMELTGVAERLAVKR
ncbi:MAG: MotA/TolQ/ExbB proton channel family protein [Candidatus Methylomirabilales bacterium]